jgi:TetR/AcrR family transcriptional regulator, transcriptional repressor for nem operon
MIRPRQFDLDMLRECVTDVFLEHGYRGTSVSMLTEASGLGKQSLYNALGDKEAAYMQALDCASQRYAALEQAMADSPDGRTAVVLFFTQAINGCTSSDASLNSCMLTSGLVEGIEAKAVADKLQEKWRELCMLVEREVQRGQRDGSIRSDVSCAALRGVLTTLMLGLRVASKTNTDPQSLHTTVHWALKLLDKGSPPPD